MKTAGLVLDFYDDARGEILKEKCPTADDLPEQVKTAHILSREERDVLRDEAFALILHNDGAQLRKFACVDEGNTVLSTVYFMETCSKLPVEAVKVAAANLIAFNEEFGLPVPPDLLLAAETGMSVKAAGLGTAGAAIGAVAGGKYGDTPGQRALGAVYGGLMGGGAGVITDAALDVAAERYRKKLKKEKGQEKAARVMTRTRDTRAQPYAGDEADWAQRTNILSIRGGADSGRVIPTANAMKTAAKMRREGEGETTLDRARRWGMQGAGTGALGGLALDAVRNAKRTGTPFPSDLWDSTLGGGIAGYVTGRAAHLALHGPADANTRTKKEKKANVVDVSALEPEAPVLQKVAEKTALAGRYALDSYSDVQNAIDFFNENWTAMPPEHRHEFCVKTAARADELGIQLPEIMDRYGSTEYAPDVEAHLANRRSVSPQYKEVWNALTEKRASVSPDTFVELLRKADESAGLDFDWGGVVADPYYATYGGRSDTEKLAWAWQDGMGETVSEEELKGISSGKLAKSFAPDFVQAFSLNPTAIFDSMPAEHKTIIARMAKE